ncbi:hypothetical protein [Pseudomonas sp. D(2018)]|uniref:hypothetical protein n=1 Tax=Pseudomonas sp. D(2018) TaxID=2502238 RepID=UPI0010F7544C|nr:hypothetical protein [Pseudomonas sp. D(2018)]
MNVGQLIAILKQCPSEMEVMVEGYETGFDPIHALSHKTLLGVQHAEDYDGLYDAPEELAIDLPDGYSKGIQAALRRPSGEPREYIVITGLRGHRR